MTTPWSQSRSTNTETPESCLTHRGEVLAGCRDKAAYQICLGCGLLNAAAGQCGITGAILEMTGTKLDLNKSFPLTAGYDSAYDVLKASAAAAFLTTEIEIRRSGGMQVIKDKIEHYKKVQMRNGLGRGARERLSEMKFLGRAGRAAGYLGAALTAYDILVTQIHCHDTYCK